MNLQHLKYAVKVAEYHSINKAAEVLYISQPNLSRAIRELEQETGRPVVTSENAQTLQQLVTGVVEGAAELAEGMEELQHKDNKIYDKDLDN